MLQRNALPLLVLWIGLASLMLAGATWASAQQARRAGSLTFEDYLQIQQLYSRYYHAIDAADAKLRVAKIELQMKENLNKATQGYSDLEVARARADKDVAEAQLKLAQAALEAAQ